MMNNLFIVASRATGVFGIFEPVTQNFYFCDGKAVYSLCDNKEQKLNTMQIACWFELFELNGIDCSVHLRLAQLIDLYIEWCMQSVATKQPPRSSIASR